jgi:3-deoxy-D-manno-octulosonate 8-phosphate phosphatase (KDO 8-P phosphatase)
MTPAQQFPPDLLLRAQGSALGMKAAIFDVDGVLTDGRLHIDEDGEVFKSFHALDGHGLKLLAQHGITPGATRTRYVAASRTWALPMRFLASTTSWRPRLSCCSPCTSIGPTWP